MRQAVREAMDISGVEVAERVWPRLVLLERQRAVREPSVF
jgi:hypothetical protein